MKLAFQNSNQQNWHGWKASLRPLRTLLSGYLIADKFVEDCVDKTANRLEKRGIGRMALSIAVLGVGIGAMDYFYFKDPASFYTGKPQIQLQCSTYPNNCFPEVPILGTAGFSIFAAVAVLAAYCAKKTDGAENTNPLSDTSGLKLLRFPFLVIYGVQFFVGSVLSDMSDIGIASLGTALSVVYYILSSTGNGTLDRIKNWFVEKWQSIKAGFAKPVEVPTT